MIGRLIGWILFLAGLAVLVKKTWQFVWFALSSDLVNARCRLPPRSMATIGKTPRLVVPAGPVYAVGVDQVAPPSVDLAMLRMLLPVSGM